MDWTASWINHPDIEADATGAPFNPDVFPEAWTQNIWDVKRSDFLIVYAKPSDPIRGTLIEAGCAIGQGIPVLAVGLSEEHNWLYHPGVRIFESISATRPYLYRFTTMVPPTARKGRRTENE